MASAAARPLDAEDRERNQRVAAARFVEQEGREMRPAAASSMMVCAEPQPSSGALISAKTSSSMPPVTSTAPRRSKLRRGPVAARGEQPDAPTRMIARTGR